MATLWDFLTLTKGWTYVFALVLLLSFIPFYLFLVAREPKLPKLPEKD